jgi:hypothetical protein
MGMALTRRINEKHIERPFADNRMLRPAVHPVVRKRTGTLKKRCRHRE